MTVVFSLGTGILAGIALFFILQRLGVIDKWIDRWDR
jgi:hypothetical protein